MSEMRVFLLIILCLVVNIGVIYSEQLKQDGEFDAQETLLDNAGLSPESQHIPDSEVIRNYKSKKSDRKLIDERNSLHLSRNTTKSTYSGLYTPNVKINMEAYTASWLVSRRRYVEQLYEQFQGIGNLEGATFAVVASGHNLMTRDYYDLFNVHLSVTIGQLPEMKKLDLNLDTGKELAYRMRYTADTLKNSTLSPISFYASHTFRSRHQHIQQATVCLIPFNLASGSHIYPDMKELNKFLAEMKYLFLEATFWSVYRYFKKIVLACASQKDIDAVKKLNLPIWKYVNLSEGLESTYLLPKQALKYLHGKLSGKDPSTSDKQDWEDIRYVYFTEADQILYARKLPVLFNVLDEWKDHVAILPHRIQTAPLPKTFTASQRSLFNGWPLPRINGLEKVNVIIEDPITPKGSCCDAGRFNIKCVMQFWYQCHRVGLQNYSDWVRFGDGFTMPLGTEHQGKCQHYPNKHVCPMPSSCSKRIPSNPSEMCEEIPEVVQIAIDGK